MNEPVLRLEGVAVSYRQKRLFKPDIVTPVFSELSFSVGAGETLGVIGRNGAGKSTLLRMLTGIISPDQGTIHTKVQRLALLSLSLGFLPNLSGRQNAVLSCMLYGMNRREAEALQPDIQSFSELEEQYDRAIHTYSSGMRARLGFAIAIQVDPDVLLVDEVLAVGDIRFREKSSAALKRLITGHKTCLFVSHSLPEVKQLCDRVVWLHEGKIRMIGEPSEVVAQYMKYFEM